MGIQINDIITLPSGLKVQNAYAGFANNLLTVTPISSPTSPTGKLYNVQAPYCIWVNDECRKAGNDPLMIKQLAFTIGPDKLNEGVYGVLYGELCGRYQDVVNTDLQPQQQPSSSAPADQPSSSAPADSTAPADSNAPADSTAPADSSAPTDSSAPADQQAS